MPGSELKVFEMVGSEVDLGDFDGEDDGPPVDMLEVFEAMKHVPLPDIVFPDHDPISVDGSLMDSIPSSFPDKTPRVQEDSASPEVVRRKNTDGSGQPKRKAAGGRRVSKRAKVESRATENSSKEAPKPTAKVGSAPPAAAAKVAAEVAPDIFTGGLVAEAGPRPDFSLWTSEDDLLLCSAMEAGYAMEALAKGALRFSRPFTMRELRERWRALLYDLEVSTEAASRMAEAKFTNTLSMRKEGRDQKTVEGRPKKRRPMTIRNLYYKKRRGLNAPEPEDGAKDHSNDPLEHSTDGEPMPVNGLGSEGLTDNGGNPVPYSGPLEVGSLSPRPETSLDLEDGAFSQMFTLLALGGVEAVIGNGTVSSGMSVYNQEMEMISTGLSVPQGADSFPPVDLGKSDEAGVYAEQVLGQPLKMSPAGELGDPENAQGNESEVKVDTLHSPQLLEDGTNANIDTDAGLKIYQHLPVQDMKASNDVETAGSIQPECPSGRSCETGAQEESSEACDDGKEREKQISAAGYPSLTPGVEGQEKQISQAGCSSPTWDVEGAEGQISQAGYPTSTCDVEENEGQISQAGYPSSTCDVGGNEGKIPQTGYPSSVCDVERHEGQIHQARYPSSACDVEGNEGRIPQAGYPSSTCDVEGHEGQISQAGYPSSTCDVEGNKRPTSQAGYPGSTCDVEGNEGQIAQAGYPSSTCDVGGNEGQIFQTGHPSSTCDVEGNEGQISHGGYPSSTCDVEGNEGQISSAGYPSSTCDVEGNDGQISQAAPSNPAGSVEEFGGKDAGIVHPHAICPGENCCYVLDCPYQEGNDELNHCEAGTCVVEHFVCTSNSEDTEVPSFEDSLIPSLSPRSLLEEEAVHLGFERDIFGDRDGGDHGDRDADGEFTGCSSQQADSVTRVGDVAADSVFDPMNKVAGATAGPYLVENVDTRIHSVHAELVRAPKEEVIGATTGPQLHGSRMNTEYVFTAAQVINRIDQRATTQDDEAEANVEGCYASSKVQGHHAVPGADFSNGMPPLEPSGHGHENSEEQAEEEVESDSDFARFSDLEAMILDMDLDPADDDISARAESRKLYRRYGKVIVRAEQCVGAGLQRELTRRGALAVLYGLHLKYYMTKPERSVKGTYDPLWLPVPIPILSTIANLPVQLFKVLIGRATSDNVVDVDLGREGPANKVSRQQAHIKLKEDGIFYLRNLGRRCLTVNNKAVETGQRAILGSECLIEVGRMRLIFETNKKLVQEHVLKRSQHPP